MIVLRPNARAWWSRAAAGVLGTGALTVVLAVSLARHQTSTSIALAVTMGALAVGLFLYFRNVRVEVGADMVTVHTLWGRVRRWPRSEVKGCAFRVVSLSYLAPPSSYLIFYGADHRTLLKLSAGLWGDGAIAEANKALGYDHRATKPGSRVHTKQQLLQEFPGSVSVALVHQWSVAIVVVVVAVVVVVVLSGIVVALNLHV